MGCGLNESIKYSLTNFIPDGLQAVSRVCPEFQISWIGDEASIQLECLSRISELMYIFNNPNVSIFSVQNIHVPIGAVFEALPRIKEFKIKDAEIVRTFTHVDFVRALYDEFNDDEQHLDQFLNDVYGINPYFKFERLINRTDLEGTLPQSFFFLSYFPSIRVLNVSGTNFCDKDVLEVDCFLSSIEAKHTKIRQVKCFYHFVRLQNLNLSYCDLSECDDASEDALTTDEFHFSGLESSKSVVESEKGTEGIRSARRIIAPESMLSNPLNCLQSLNLTGCGLLSLRFLIVFTNIKRLYINQNAEIDDFSPVFWLRRLSFLSCASCGNASILMDDVELRKAVKQESHLLVVNIRQTSVCPLFFRLSTAIARLEMDSLSYAAFAGEAYLFESLRELSIEGISTKQAAAIREAFAGRNVDITLQTV